MVRKLSKDNEQYETGRIETWELDSGEIFKRVADEQVCYIPFFQSEKDGLHVKE